MAVGIIDPRRRPCSRKVEPFKKQMKVNGEINKSIECAKDHEHFGQALLNYPGDDFLVKGKLTHLNSRVLDIFTSIKHCLMDNMT